MLVDSHSHLFLEEFADDLPQVMQRAREAGVTHIFMPNIDSTTIESLLSVCAAYKEFCFPMIGLHPTSVNKNYKKELDIVAGQLASSNGYVAIGEIGLDLYWDKTFLREQLLAFEKQVEWALEYHLPIVIHTREAFDYIYKVLQPYKETGFMIGINGVVTFKKSQLPEVLKDVPLAHIVLETDSPYLTPVPNRGKRNESARLKDTLIKVAEIYRESPEVVAEATSENALKVFGMGK